VTNLKSAAEAAGKNRAVLKEDTNTRASYLLKQGIRPVVSIALLILLFSLLVDVNDVWTAIMAARPGGIALAIALIILALLVSAIKWGILLRAQVATISLPYLFNTYLVGLFFNNFLPSNVGGDVARIADIAKRTGKAPEATASVIGERLISGMALALTALIGLLFSPQVSGQFAPIVGGLILFFVFVMGLFASRRAKRIISTVIRRLLGPKWFERIGRVAGSIALAIRNPSTFLWAMFWSFAFHITLVLVNYAIFIALNINLPLISFVLYVPIIAAIQLVPVSVNGFGVREVAYVYFFGTVGVSSSGAAAASLLFGILVMLVSLPGGLIFASRR
jgi:uncharacterized protein (TIRG00374 family)